jgi:hypothetical protein
MTQRSLRRTLTALCTAVVAAGILGVAAGPPAGAEARDGVPPPPPSGSGIVIQVITPQPIGPLSFT